MARRPRWPTLVDGTRWYHCWNCGLDMRLRSHRLDDPPKCQSCRWPDAHNVTEWPAYPVITEGQQCLIPRGAVDGDMIYPDHATRWEVLRTQMIGLAERIEPPEPGETDPDKIRRRLKFLAATQVSPTGR